MRAEAGIAVLHDALAAARQRLVSAGISPDEATVDVDFFACTILGWDRARLLAELRGPVPSALEPTFSEWLTRRAAREPSAYIVGFREFWGLDFVVSPAVLIPRPETEFVVEELIPLVRELPAPRIADIGTGSGCIAVSIAREVPAARIVASDVSAEALAIARLNAERHGVSDRVDFIETSFLDAVDGDFDAIAANPPYVRQIDKPALSPSVRYEPDVALFGGDNGLRDLASTLDAAITKLRPGGWLVMEFGFGQEDDVRALIEERPQLRIDHVRADLQGLARTAVVQKAAPDRPS